MYDQLIGRPVQVTRSVGKPAGRFYGVVRKIDGGPRKGLRSLTIQRASNPEAGSLSARYRGEKVRVDARDVDGVYHRRRVGPVADFLGL